MDVSVVISNYNNALFIGKTLDTVLNQDFIGSIEVIVIDDCSTDNSLSVISKYENRIKLISLERNIGLSSVRNVGIENAGGDYIVFIDGDDFLEKDYISVLFESVKDQGNILPCCNFFAVDSDGEVLKEEKHKKEFEDNNYIPISLLLNGTLTTLVWDKIYIARIIKENKLYFLSGVNNEDLEFNAKYLIFIDDIKILDKTLIYYRQHLNSITKKIDFKLLEDMYKVVGSILTLLYENNLYQNGNVASSFKRMYLYYCIVIGVKRCIKLKKGYRIKGFFNALKLHKKFCEKNNFKVGFLDVLKLIRPIKQRVILFVFLFVFLVFSNVL